MSGTKHTPTPQEEILARSDPLHAMSLQTIIDSPNFRDYEKSMARELLKQRNSRDALLAALHDLHLDGVVQPMCSHDISKVHVPMYVWNKLRAAIKAAGVTI